MRIAFVDLLFSWPPNGGADVDLYHTIQGLEGAGHEVHLFVSASEQGWERGAFDPEGMPFAATRFPIPAAELTGPTLGRIFREALDSWKPDAVFIGDGFFLKPFVIEALAGYPLIGRYYAYEVPCMRDMLLFKDGAPCPKNYLTTPNVCRRCAVKGMGKSIRPWRIQSWTEEYLSAKAYLPGYHRRLTDALGQLDAIVVYNDLMRTQFAPFNDEIHVIPGGVEASAFTASENSPGAANAKTIVLMVGRVEDPMKGFATLFDAGTALAERRDDFEIWATHTDRTLDRSWFKAIGWQGRDSLQRIYAKADICVVPSIWEEPFGLVALEAMAAATPVCASRVGGLQTIVVHEKTGLLFDRGDSAGLAVCLSTMLDDAGLRRAMGVAGRRRAEELYRWDRIIEGHYPALFEAILA